MADRASGHVVVFVTAPNVEEAEGIGKKVVAEKLAACCNIVPGLKSIYTWKGQLLTEGEVLCIFKTKKVLFERLRDRVVELHSYDVPEVIATEITSGLQDYLRWIDEATT
ncbi:MAG TPA: divalent-cation tolerance protein CutA [Thermodesulfobacteriota bacterium]|nr:divalent-cation tolerance protein CutA [Thermodesulfobacteriota bacterium]